MTADTAPTVISDHRCHLGEGPSYDADTNTLFWFDIVERTLFEKRWPEGAVVAHTLPLMASAIASIDADRQLLVTETGLSIRDRKTGSLSQHVAVEADNPLTRSNDARVHPCGALWFGTMAKDGKGNAGSFYWYFRGEVRRLCGDIAIPNSTCFSPDGSVAYFTDTRKGLLMRVDCDPATGLPKGEPFVLVDGRDRKGGFDGSVTDADGTIWNARWGAGAVETWSPDGQLLGSVPVPARQVSCPVFVGADAAGLAVTTAWEGMDEAARDADPHCGKTFLLSVKVRGRFDPSVKIA